MFFSFSILNLSFPQHRSDCKITQGCQISVRRDFQTLHSSEAAASFIETKDFRLGYYIKEGVSNTFQQ